jgi:hypothetical protein
MLPGPTLIYQCPNCENTIRKESIMSGNTFGARFFTDGKRLARMLPEFPNLTKCQKCNDIFWLSKLKSTSTYEWGASINTESQKHDRAIFLSINEYYKALTLAIINTKNEELIVRKRIWWTYNDRLRMGDELFQDDDDEVRWRDNVIKLKALLSLLDINQKIMIAEINRNLGDFDACIRIIQSIKDKKLDWLKEVFIAECKRKNKWMIELKN